MFSEWFVYVVWCQWSFTPTDLAKHFFVVMNSSACFVGFGFSDRC